MDDDVLSGIEHPQIRELLVRAQEADVEGRPDDALAIYAEAYAKFPTSVVSAEVGLAELKAKQYVQAARHLRWALTLGGYPFTKRPLEYLLDKLGEAKRKVGTLQVRTNVDQARLSVDSTAVYAWPTVMELYVTPGEPHHLRLTREGFWPAQETVTLEPGETKDLFLSMEERTVERIVRLPTRIAASVSTDMREQTVWPRHLLIASSGVLGASVAVGFVGYWVRDTGREENDPSLTTAGLGMLVGGGIGLGLSVFGIGAAIASMPPAPAPKIELSPEIAKGRMGIGLRGVW
ncbi:PEGA domain-containing protein [Polyangium aurulentum]|uniref:PEGA domain-containing protein n=1 Tax=Polyangium aurulentum TaxID=2567896 RepID=UPI00146CCC28|nr:PEGA domain-containing protein [Polyangium aurulentum]UQA62653.1 PEGA domain-containing protein [Polyangium aurulentum]